MRYVIAYDVSDDRRRERLARVLLDYGERVQLSVFEMDLSPDDLETIRGEVTALIGGEDSVRFYPMCQACLGRIVTDGRQRGLGEEVGWVV